MVTDVNACACDIGREKEAVIAIVPENYSFFAAVQIVPILYPLLLCIGVLSFIYVCTSYNTAVHGQQNVNVTNEKCLPKKKLVGTTSFLWDTACGRC